ncbi:MAG: aspartate dehydrogenase [Candidatus Omnitrophica bacterium]|nr:aspartate dehydrogenase [Candidatus Omnitrophota bacterium]
MTNRIKIGIVGCGAIGSSLAKFIKKDFNRKAKLVALYDLDRQKAMRLSGLAGGCPVAKDLAQLITRSDLVIEAASKDCSFSIARQSLIAGRDCMIMSVGGIIDKFKVLEALADRRGAKVFIPSGAITGIDGLKSARLAKIKRIVLTTIKNPASFKGVAYVRRKGINLEKIKKELTLFSGSARQAVRFFPQNINVAAILSLAGLGPDKTKVRIVAAPGVKTNTHEIEIYSEAGTIRTRTENVLHPDNPKTSFLAVLSALAVLKQILEPIRIGT